MANRQGQGTDVTSTPLVAPSVESIHSLEQSGARALKSSHRSSRQPAITTRANASAIDNSRVLQDVTLSAVQNKTAPKCRRRCLSYCIHRDCISLNVVRYSYNKDVQPVFF